jgi:sugar lactone lactonase YvrE
LAFEGRGSTTLRPAFCILALAFCSATSAQSLEDVAASRKVFAEAAQARERGDADEYLRLMREVVKLRPDQPGAQFRLAGALARKGDVDAASAILKRIAAQGLFFRVEGDPDFANIRDALKSSGADDALTANLAPREASEVAFRLADTAVLPEGLAHDPKTNTFYIASVHQRRIIARLPDGTEKTFGKGRDDGLWSVLALKVDAERRHLWATTAAIEQTQDLNAADAGRTAVVQYDLDTGKVLKRFEPPREKDKARVFGDLVVSSSGRVIVSEANHGGLWRISNGVLEAFVPPGKFASPQGMAFPNQGNWLYVADYSLGLMRVDIATRKVERVKSAADTSLLGLDGMVRFGNDLIATQNGIRPHRVLRIRLDGTGQVAGVEVLEANHPAYAEPTLGVLVGNHFHYVANSQWDKFVQGKAAADVAAPVILKLPLR